MKKNPLQDKVKMMFLVFLGSLLFFGLLTAGVKTQTEETKVSVVPEKQQVGGDDIQLPKSFYVDINVTDVVDLYAWQVNVYYYSRILNLTGKEQPSGHVFDGRDPYELDAENETWRKILMNNEAINFSDPIGSSWKGESEEPDDPEVPRDYNITGWLDKDGTNSLSASDIIILDPVLPDFIEYYRIDRIAWEDSIIRLHVSMSHFYWGSTLLGAEPGFNGSGTLFRLTFDAIRPGAACLNISSVNTYLVNSSEGEDIIQDVELLSDYVQVSGIPAEKDLSEISIKTNLAVVDAGSDVTISGRINPAKTGAEVNVYYRTEGETEWDLLATTNTNSTSGYNHVWTSPEANVYELKANWTGDQITQGSESDPIKVTVGEEAPPPIDYLPYIIVA
ncbi:hypothetical protein KAU55_06035, partial [Candidatus Bathyarchaeota archaeon]|nr:hypothetical protein [Candidatus Bathyarchaeota archaeon]